MNLIHAGRDGLQKPSGLRGTEQGAAGPPTQLLAHYVAVGLLLGYMVQDVHHYPLLEQGQEGQVGSVAVGQFSPGVFHGGGQVRVAVFLGGAWLKFGDALAQFSEEYRRGHFLQQGQRYLHREGMTLYQV